MGIFRFTYIFTREYSFFAFFIAMLDIAAMYYLDKKGLVRKRKSGAAPGSEKHKKKNRRKSGYSMSNEKIIVKEHVFVVIAVPAYFIYTVIYYMYLDSASDELRELYHIGDGFYKGALGAYWMFTVCVVLTYLVLREIVRILLSRLRSSKAK